MKPNFLKTFSPDHFSRTPKPTVAVPSHFDRKFVVLSDVKYWYVVAQLTSDGSTGTRNLIFGQIDT